MKKIKASKIQSAALLIYIILQNLMLFLLRKLFLMTVYQTVASYMAICIVGISLVLFLPDSLRTIRNSYLIFWSGVHGVILLGFLTCGTYYLTLTEITIVQLVNIFLGIALYWILYLCTRNVSAAAGLGNLIIGFLGVLNRYLVRFRGAPFNLSDLKAARTAGNVAQNYDFTPDSLMIVAVIDLILWYVIWKFYLGRSVDHSSADKLPPRKSLLGFWNWWTGFVTAIVLCGCAALPIMNFKEIYANTTLFAQDAYLSTLLADIMGNDQSLPDDYSVEKVETIIERYRKNKKKEDINSVIPTLANMAPNIVVIMNESFSDLRVL